MPKPWQAANHPQGVTACQASPHVAHTVTVSAAADLQTLTLWLVGLLSSDHIAAWSCC
jgi:hypothetical protein